MIVLYDAGDYLIKTDTGCYLIDSGVAGSERMIEKTVIESGYHPSDIKAIFLTHAHPDHIGTASYFREKYGAAIYASEGERTWIEDIDLQFAAFGRIIKYKVILSSLGSDISCRDA